MTYRKSITGRRCDETPVDPEATEPVPTTETTEGDDGTVLLAT